jgi:cobalt-zinc-cadmium efflux system outer membrane protein
MLLSACVVVAVAARPDAAAAADNESPARMLGAPSADQLTLTEALAITLANNPELAAAHAAVAASGASARQAGSFVNPELSLEVENFAGSDELSGFDGAETTLRLDQTIELGGKRAQRRASGSAAQAVAVQQQQLTRADLYARTVEAFMGLLAAQERWHLAETRLQLATKTLASIEAQIEAGKSPTIAGIRSRPLLIEARLELDRAAGELNVARQALAALLGVADAATLVAQGDLAALPEVPEPGTVESSIPSAPQLALASAARDQAAQDLAGEKLRAVPDVTVGLGVRRFEGGGEHALVAGLSVPLPLFDRNRHGIAAAAARLEQARSAERNAQLSTRAALAQAVQELRARRDEARALQDELLPAAQQSFEAVDHGYRAGKFGLLDLLDAQRQLSEVQSRLLSAQVDCHVAAARLDGLLGRLPLAATGATP